ncbi:type II toxin-antitoxin system Phd/YefM family antitoxin [Cupriavidus necator]|uniref:Type II toxin-antitoxin system Phd/YefM family antitoxin n=1 Tax=Cupriavidus necator TaxID=106590 RepID=A0A367PJY6_CUPNE|nr:type II toxin-antitoxin system Phd/YefM family antitoxin [Cupriavidus necator]QQX84086.1 type II toxin-antitoxin system Phd/YefM family antitoxin [Cupriavidus necator]RCJ08190.1 type II toxin-antitoxin system Phd/YefM family antitoxin [Cupriavidus necator]
MAGGLISKTEFKARALEYFRQIEASGDPVIVTDHGKPTLEVRRCRGLERDPLQVLRGTVLHYDAPTEPVDVECEVNR